MVDLPIVLGPICNATATVRFSYNKPQLLALYMLLLNFHTKQIYVAI